ncbi:MAG: ABC transporter substrate-binding protein [Candidatus Goldiibacteriota bacterium]
MRKIKKCFWAVMFFVFAGTGAVPAAAGAAELTVWNMPSEAEEQYRKLWNENVRNFQVRHPNIRIRGISREYKPQEFVSVMASGKGPDVVSIPITAVPAMARHGFLADLNSKAEQWIQKDHLPAVMWNSVTIDGKIFAIPNDSFFTTLFIRKDVFKEYGITKNPENWDDLIKISRIINGKDDGISSIVLPPDMFYFVDFIWQAGGDVYSGENIVLTNPAVAKALKFWHSLKWKHNAMPPQNIIRQSDAEQLFSCGKTAMMPGVAKQLPVMARRYGLDLEKVEIIPLPAGPEGIKAWHSGGTAFIVNSGISTEKKDMAWQYIRHVLNPIRQLWKYNRMKELDMIIFPGDFSAATNLINMQEFKNVKGLIRYAQSEPPLYAWPMIKEDFNKYVLEKIFIEENINIEKLLFEFDKLMRERNYE